VPALARIAVAAGADGLLVEVHPHPDKAWSDGDQSLDFAGFDSMMDSIEPYLAMRSLALAEGELARREPTRSDEGLPYREAAAARAMEAVG
jgi:hypothetical protein